MMHKLIPATFIAAMIATPATATSVRSNRNLIAAYLEVLTQKRLRPWNAAENLASTGGWIKLWLFDEIGRSGAIFVCEYG